MSFGDEDLREHKCGSGLRFVSYPGERFLGRMKRLIEKDLSEPYSIYTYRGFLSFWPRLCILCFKVKEPEHQKDEEEPPIQPAAGMEGGVPPEDLDPEDLIGVAVSKVDSREHRGGSVRGYIGMLAVEKEFRKRGIGRQLIEFTLERFRAMQEVTCVMLEADEANTPALKLYDSLGFVCTKRLYKYYSAAQDAYRLKHVFLEKLVPLKGGEGEGVGEEGQEEVGKESRKGKKEKKKSKKKK